MQVAVCSKHKREREKRGGGGGGEKNGGEASSIFSILPSPLPFPFALALQASAELAINKLILNKREWSFSLSSDARNFLRHFFTGYLVFCLNYGNTVYELINEIERTNQNTKVAIPDWPTKIQYVLT